MKKIAMLMLALVLAVLPFQAVQAAAQKNVILNSEDGKAEIYIELPDAAGQISSLRFRVRIGGDIEHIDQTNPLKFQLDEGIRSTFLETRYNAGGQTYTIYLSDTSRLTDKTEFRLGMLTPNSLDGAEYSLTLTVEEDGLEYVDRSGQLNQDQIAAPVSAGIQVNAQGSEDDDATGGSGETGDGSGNTVGNGGASGTGMATAAENGGVSGTGTATAAETGDNSQILGYVVLLGAAGAGVAGVQVLRKRKNR